MSSSSTSHGYFDSVSTQLSLSVGSSFEGVAGNSSANASEGVSASVSAVDTGMKAGMALAGAFDAGMESAYVPALAGLGLKGMACLPISKQLDPVLGIDCHIMIPSGPLPNPYIGLLINLADFITAAIASVLPPPPPMPEEGGGGDADLTYERNEFGELTCFSAGQAEAPGRFESRHEYDSLGFELERMLPGGVTQRKLKHAAIWD